MAKFKFIKITEFDNNVAIIKFENSIIASINDYFIIRKYSP